jgi:drug/metabolite transporter (DMT)-like permease
MTPAFALLFGWLFLNEPVTWIKVSGIALVAAGIYLVNASEADEVDRQPSEDSEGSEGSSSSAQELMQ